MRAFALLLIGLLCGCARAPRDYPIGLYAVFEPNDVPALAEAGFNHVLGKLDERLLESARTNRLSVFADPFSRLPALNRPRAQEAVRNFDKHPALAGWYIVDEPDLANIPPDEVQRAIWEMKRFGARKPIVVVLGTGLAAVDYAGLGDITLLDRYPINTRPLPTFAQHLRMARLAGGPKRPLYAVIQAFNWRYYTNHVVGNPEMLRPPVESEIRCMTYLALVERANGLFYYCWDDGKWSMREHPQTWEALKSVVAEVRERAALFAGAHKWFRHEVQYIGSPRLNDVLEPSLSLAFIEVTDDSPLLARGHYLVVVNTTADEVRARIRMPGDPLDALYVIGESRIAQMDANSFVTEIFAPYQARVFGPMTERPLQHAQHRRGD